MLYYWIQKSKYHLDITLYGFITPSHLQVCSSLIDPVLHCREMGLNTLPSESKRMLTENDADDYVIERNIKFGLPIPDNLKERAKVCGKEDDFSSTKWSPWSSWGF